MGFVFLYIQGVFIEHYHILDGKIIEIIIATAVTDKTSKWNAILDLCNKLKIKPEDVMTIGDSGNDYEMIKKAGIGVAMGNAFDEVKDVANCITDSINEDGFYNYIKNNI